METISDNEIGIEIQPTVEINVESIPKDVQVNGTFLAGFISVNHIWFDMDVNVETLIPFLGLFKFRDLSITRNVEKWVDFLEPILARQTVCLVNGIHPCMSKLNVDGINLENAVDVKILEHFSPKSVKIVGCEFPDRWYSCVENLWFSHSNEEHWKTEVQKFKNLTLLYLHYEMEDLPPTLKYLTPKMNIRASKSSIEKWYKNGIKTIFFHFDRQYNPEDFEPYPDLRVYLQKQLIHGKSLLSLEHIIKYMYSKLCLRK